MIIYNEPDQVLAIPRLYNQAMAEYQPLAHNGEKAAIVGVVIDRRIQL